MKKNVENRTMAIVLAELNTSIDAYNLSTDAVERVNLTVKHKNLTQEYNDLSLLSAYAECMKADKPLMELAKRYYYNTVSVKDAVHNEVENGVQKSSVTRSVQEGDKKFNVVKFIEWTAERNKSVAADKSWKSKMEAARAVVEGEWKKFFTSNGDTHSMSIGKTKKALQEMFDALLFVASESGKNAIIANGDVAKWVLGFANSRKDSKVDGKITITGNVLPKATWGTLQLDILHKAVTDKTFDIVYGDPEEVEEDAEPKAKSKKGKAEEKPEAKK